MKYTDQGLACFLPPFAGNVTAHPPKDNEKHSHRFSASQPFTSTLSRIIYISMTNSYPNTPNNNTSSHPPLVLASISPRRRELLGSLGIPFEIIPSGVDESRLQAPTPREFAILAAKEKCLDVARRQSSGTIVVAADTIVCVPNDSQPGETILGKPSGPEEARAMLGRLSGRTHRVITGVAVQTSRGEILTDTEETLVRFRPLSAEEIADYVATGEPLDKAGAYGAQGLGVRLIESVEGDFTNVIGLPMDLLRRLLAQDDIVQIG